MSRLVLSYGAVYCLTERTYKKFIKAGSEGYDWDLKNFGPMLGPVQNVTDWETKDFAEELEEIAKKVSRKPK